MRKKPPKRLIQTAYHEAGHVVAFHELGIKVEMVTIVPNEESLGRVDLEAKDPWPRLRSVKASKRWPIIQRFYNEAIGALAAWEAVAYYDPEFDSIVGSMTDRERVIQILRPMYNFDPRNWGYVEAKARELVRKPKNWRKIKGLAKALLEHKTLSGDALLALLK